MKEMVGCMLVALAMGGPRSCAAAEDNAVAQERNPPMRESPSTP